MRKFLNQFVNVKWGTWLGPVGMMLCAYILIRLFFSDQSFFAKIPSDFVSPGQIPSVSYRLSPTGVSIIVTAILSVLFFLQTLRVWARYYLNRKLVISYFFLAIIPLVTLATIFFMVVRLWIGISNANTIEQTMGIFSRDLGGFADSIQKGVAEKLRRHVDITQSRVMTEIIASSRDQELGGYNYVELNDILVDVYYLAPKIPGVPRGMFHVFSEEGEAKTGIMVEDTEAFEAIVPPWFLKNSYMGIVNQTSGLAIQHFNLKPAEEGAKILVLTRLPIDEEFLGKMQEFQKVRIILEPVVGDWYYITENEADKWYWRILLGPLRSVWHLQALDWSTGRYSHSANMSFEVSPSEIISAFSNQHNLNFFYREQKEYQGKIILYFTLALWLGIFVAYIFGIYLIGYITRSLNLIAQGHENVAMGRLDYRLPYLGKDQIGAIGRSFNGMVGNIESLLEQVRETQKYQEELRIARDIQMSLLPDVESLTFCKDIAAACIPAREVGGDYYEVLDVGSGRIGIFIADVSGKGTSAAFYMAELKGVLIALRDAWNNPKELMLRMNAILQPALANNVFISAAYLLLDTKAGNGQLARAGHCPAILLSASKRRTQGIMPPGIAIGLADNKVFGKIIKVAHFDMEPDDKVVLFTDGLDEMSFHDEMYGIERLKEVLVMHAGKSSQALKDEILQDVLGFLSSGEQNDDLTLVVAGIARDDAEEPVKAAAGRRKKRKSIDMDEG